MDLCEALKACTKHSVCVCVCVLFVCLFHQCTIKEGGLVPKSLYRSLEFAESGESSWGSEIYQTVHVSKGSPHEVSGLACQNHLLENMLPWLCQSKPAILSKSSNIRSW